MAESSTPQPPQEKATQSSFNPCQWYHCAAELVRAFNKIVTEVADGPRWSIPEVDFIRRLRDMTSVRLNRLECFWSRFRCCAASLPACLILLQLLASDTRLGKIVPSRTDKLMAICKMQSVNCPAPWERSYFEPPRALGPLHVTFFSSIFCVSSLVVSLGTRFDSFL
jgi:hypothetical protein